MCVITTCATRRTSSSGSGWMVGCQCSSITSIDSHAVIEVRSPYSGDIVGTVEASTAADAGAAIDAAARALESPLPAHERAAILDRTAALLRDRQEEMAQTICSEAGK